MRNTNIFLVAVLILPAFFSGCKGWFGGGDNESEVVAKYKNTTLHLNQLRHYVPSDVSAQDSARYAEYYIEQWLKEMAIGDVAQQKIPDLQERIDFKVNDYRRKLIIHEYTSYLIENELDTTVTEDQIRNYYQVEKEQFRSREKLYSYFYIVVGDRSTSGVSGMMRSNTQEKFDELKAWCGDNALDYKLDSSYVGTSEINRVSKGYFGDLKKSQVGKLIRWNGVIQGQRRKYFFKMLNVVKEDEILPLALTRDKIQTILLNERKIELIKNSDKRIIDDARARNYIVNNF